MSSDLVARMREKLEAGYPVPWIPNENGDEDEIIGTFVRLEQAPTRSYGMQWVMILAEAETGVERSVWLLHTVLRNELSKLKPVTGEVVAIKHLGKKEPQGGGQEYDDYRVVVDRVAGTQANWDAVGGATPTTAAAPAPAAPAAPPATPALCEHCGFANGQHAAGCPGVATDDDIPF